MVSPKTTPKQEPYPQRKVVHLRLVKSDADGRKVKKVYVDRFALDPDEPSVMDQAELLLLIRNRLALMTRGEGSLSFAELHRRSNAHVKTISRLADGESVRPGFLTILRVCRAINIDLRWDDGEGSTGGIDTNERRRNRRR